MRKRNKKRFFRVKHCKTPKTLTLDLTRMTWSKQTTKIELEKHSLLPDRFKSETCSMTSTKFSAWILKKEKTRNMTPTIIGSDKYLTYGTLAMAKTTRRHRHIQPQEKESRVMMHLLMTKTLRWSYKRQRITSKRLTAILKMKICLENWTYSDYELKGHTHLF